MSGERHEQPCFTPCPGVPPSCRPKGGWTGLGLPASLRLRRAHDFDAVYAARTFRRCGPLTIHAARNERAATRLGLAISRKVGKAVVRNRVKRLVREAFRLSQHDLPGGYDVVISVRPHEPLSRAAYHRMLTEAIIELDSTWRKRRDK